MNTEVRIARLNAAGTDWEEVVGGTSPINHDPGQDASDPSLTAIDGVPYVAWIEADGVNFELRVARLNAAGTDWDEVVGGASPINHDPGHNAGAPSLTSIGSVPYVAWRELATANHEIRVARLNAAGTDWEELVGGASPVNHDPGQNAIDPSLTAIGGVPYVAWGETDDVNYEARVARPNAAATEWDEVVDGASPVNHDPARNASGSRLTAIGGVPYMAWAETDGAAVEQVRVSRLVPDFLAGSTAFPTGPTTALLLGQLRTYGVAYPTRFELGPGAGFAERPKPYMSMAITREGQKGRLTHLKGR